MPTRPFMTPEQEAASLLARQRTELQMMNQRDRQLRSLSSQVAAALDRVPCTTWEVFGVSAVAGTEWIKRRPCNHADCFPEGSTPDYEHFWSLTGPMVERFDIGLDRGANGHCLARAKKPSGEVVIEDGDTYLEAICRVVVALHLISPARMPGVEETP